jgi:hypothetical protein
MSADWPELRVEDGWLIAAMEQRLRSTTQSSEELNVVGVRDSCFALADRYEEAAATRLSAR